MSPALARHRSHRWLCALVLAAFALFFPASVCAAAPIETVYLRYSAPRTCPSEADFVAALRRDGDTFLLVPEDGARRSVDVGIEVLADGARGRFRIVDRRYGTTIERELSGPDCEAVARALALMLTLAMHRLSESEPTGGVPIETAPAPLESRDPARAPSQVAADTVRGPQRPTAPPADVPSRRRLGWSLDLQGAFTTALFKQVVPLAAMTLEVQPSRWRFRPALAISLRQSLPAETAIAGGGVTFLWTAAALRLCPHVFIFSAFDVAPCVEGALGIVQADASGLPGARSSTTQWREATAVVVGRWHFSPRWFLTTSTFLTVPLTRNRFELSSGTLISKASPLGLGAGLGVGLEL